MSMRDACLVWEIYWRPAWMRVRSSARMTRYIMMGAASRESSQVLCSAMVLRPPMKISLV